MKQYGINWIRFLDFLPVWRKLPAQARRIVMDRLNFRQELEPGDLQEHAQTILESGLVEPVPGRSAVCIAQRFRNAVRILEAMHRGRALDGRVLMSSYVRNNVSQDEFSALLGCPVGPYQDPEPIAAKAESRSWLDAFLAARSEKDWAGGILCSAGASDLDPSAIFAATQRLVRHVMARTAPLPIGELPPELANGRRGLLAAAIRAAIQCLLLFPDLRPEDLEPVLGLWPGVADELHRVPAEPPVPLPGAPAQTFSAAWWMEDLTCLVAAAAREPLRIRADDGAIFAKHRERLVAQFMELPAWVAELAEVGVMHVRGYGTEVDATHRLDRAMRAAADMGLTRMRPTKTRQNFLAATSEGLDWVARPAKERLQAILDLLRGGRRRGAMASYFDDGILSFTPGTVQINVMGTKGYDLRSPIATAFASLEPGRFYDAAAYLRYHGEHANPLVALNPSDKPRSGIIYSIRTAFEEDRQLTPERLEWHWKNVLDAFIWQRLAPLGGIAVGLIQSPSQSPAIAITSAGRYLLGLDKTFEYGRPATASVVVQPNYEIVFLSPDPSLEAACSRFAERLAGARAVGTLLRITKASVTEAAAVGVGLEQVLSVLTGASRKPLPANVEQELRGWYAAFRDIAIRPTTLIQCPDAQTAARVLAVLGDDAARISDTLVELLDRGRQKELVKTLRAQGVFVRS